MINNKTTLRKGSTGTDVKTLQIRLQTLGYYKAKVDGDYGNITVASVKAYQKKMKLVQDGIAGPITLNSLGLIAAATSTKTSLHLSLEKAIGGEFVTLTGFYLLVKHNEKYDFYVGDKKTQKEAVDSLQKGTGNNCVDYAQLGVAIAKDLNKGYTTRYVRTYCTKDNVGHVYFQAKGWELGSNWVNIDLAAAAGSSYDIGRAWCQSWSDKIYNQEYLQDDDGR